MALIAVGCSLFDPTQDTEREVDNAALKRKIIVAAYSIRHRILKDHRALEVIGGRAGCSLFDPTQDTERLSAQDISSWAPCCSLFDPTQDTESSVCPRLSGSGCLVAAYSIRHRILKAWFCTAPAGPFPSCSLFDPTQDTESHHRLRPSFRDSIVAAYSIRHRILKDAGVNLGSANVTELQPIRSDTGY